MPIYEFQKDTAGDWKRDAVAEGYVADSPSNKNKVAKTLESVMNRIKAMINEEMSVFTSKNYFLSNWRMFRHNKF